MNSYIFPKMKNFFSDIPPFTNYILNARICDKVSRLSGGYIGIALMICAIQKPNIIEYFNISDPFIFPVHCQCLTWFCLIVLYRVLFEWNWSIKKYRKKIMAITCIIFIRISNVCAAPNVLSMLLLHLRFWPKVFLFIHNWIEFVPIISIWSTAYSTFWQFIASSSIAILRYIAIVTFLSKNKIVTIDVNTLQ